MKLTRNPRRPPLARRKVRHIRVHLRKRKDAATYMACYSIQGKEYRQPVGRDELEAKRKCCELEHRLNSSPRFREVKTATPVTLNTVIEKYWDLRGSKLRTKTRIGYRNKLNRFAAVFGGRHPQDVTQVDLEYFLARLESKEQLHASTVNGFLMVIKRLFRCAVEWNMLDASPAVHIPPRKVTHQSPRSLEPDEVRRLLACVKGTHMELFVALSVFLGTRKQETLALRWEDFQFSTDGKSGRVTIHTSLNDNATKNRRSRTVVLFPQLLEILWPCRQAAGFVCLNSRGTPLRCNTNRTMTTLYQKAGIHGEGERKVTIHSLRHTFVTLCLRNRVPERAVGYWASHQDPRTTSIYAHMSGDWFDVSGIRFY